jgi:hydrogenase maturation protease
VPDTLTKLLSDKEKKILFAGIGNRLRSDDGIGVFISENIATSGHISSLTVETGIENYIGKINSLSPDILVLIDCVDLGLAPGSSRILSLNDIQDLTFNTHNISLQRVTDFFKMPVYVLGIQPENIGFGEIISYLVMQEGERIIESVNNL